MNKSFKTQATDTSGDDEQSAERPAAKQSVQAPVRPAITADRIRAVLDGAGLRRAVDAGAIPAALYERCIAALARDLA